jgi:hypothetical protein
MAICCLGSISDALSVVSEGLCSVSDRYYSESNNCSVFDEENGRRALWGCVSYLNEREMHVMGVHLLSQ